MLSPKEKNLLARQIESLDINTFLQQQKLLHNPLKGKFDFTPFTDYSQIGSKEDAVVGHKVISDGCLGTLILAGGQGTRLKFNGPKGMYPVSIIKHKTLFQLFAEKTLAASLRAGKKLHIAIMTSASNHDETVRYFKENNYFGLGRKQVHFFRQSDLPFLDQKGNLFLETPYKISEGPAGNGSALRHFVESGIWAQWYANDIRFLNVVLIDNPLADPFDEELLGFHYRRGCDITIKSIERNYAEEKVGLIVGAPHNIKIVEYTEMPIEERAAVLRNGELKHRCANISLFCMNMEFVQDVSSRTDIPLHLAFKSAPFLSQAGMRILNPEPNAWKYERYIFDILPFASKVAALMYPREKSFAPLKNLEGEGNPSSVKAALLAFDKQTISKITGRPLRKARSNSRRIFTTPRIPC